MLISSSLTDIKDVFQDYMNLIDAVGGE